MSWWRNKVKQSLLKRDIILSRPPGQFAIMAVKLARIRDRGLKLSMAVDGGAARGDWAREFREVYPDCEVLCVEPRDDCQPLLRTLAGQCKGIHIAQTLIGDRQGQATFHQHAEQSSILPNSSGEAFGQTVTVPMTTLDALVESMKLPWPDLIKLDLQGAELTCLAGASRCLKAGQAVLLEVSFIPFQKSMPLAGEVMAFMQSKGFQLYDIMALCHRPLDGALAQGDFFFLKKNHPLLSDHRWDTRSSWA